MLKNIYLKKKEDIVDEASHSKLSLITFCSCTINYDVGHRALLEGVAVGGYRCFLTPDLPSGDFQPEGAHGAGSRALRPPRL